MKSPSELLDELRRIDFEKAQLLIDEIAMQGDGGEQLLLALLEAVDQPSIRNAIAIKLMTMGGSATFDVLVRLIQRADLVHQRATLVHCLGGFRYETAFELLVDLIVEGNFEVAHEAYSLLDDLDDVDGQQAQLAYEKLLSANNEKQIPQWRRKLVQSLLDYFS